MRKEERLVQAMNDIEERYINEADFSQKQATKVHWIKWAGLAASIAIVAFVSINLPKDVVNPPTETEIDGTEMESGEGELDRDWVEGPNGDMLLVISTDIVMEGMGGGAVTLEYIRQADKNLPWKEDMKISVLPVYENLAYSSPAGAPVYLTKDALLEKAESVAEDLNVKILSTAYTWTSEANIGPYVNGITAKIEYGKIDVEGNGRVYVTFTDGLKLPEEYSLSNLASEKEANEAVAYLLEYFSGLLKADNLIPDAYVDCDLVGNRWVKYRAVGSGEEINNIVEYYFNQVNFYFDEEKGLTGLRYGDERETAKYLGEYPIITVEGAKELLKQGKFISNYGISAVEGDVITDDKIYDVMLEYRVLNTCEYFQPYYRFYVKLEGGFGYGAFYVPAIEGKFLR